MASDLLFLRKTIYPWSDTHFVLIVDQGYSACNLTKVSFKLSLFSAWFCVETFIVRRTLTKVTNKNHKMGNSCITLYNMYNTSYFSQ